MIIHRVVAHFVGLVVALVFVPVSGWASSKPSPAQLKVWQTTLRKKGFPETNVALGECAVITKPPSKRSQQNSSPAQGTLVVLHGRGGADQLSSLVRSFQAVACKHSLRVVAPAAPTANRNWPFETNKGDGQDTFLLQLIQQDVRELFGLKNEESNASVFLLGISAGATFLMGDFYPRHGHLMRGKALALCGGAWPSQPSIAGIKSLEDKFPMFVQIGKSDFLFEQVRAGLTRYAELGLPLRAQFTDAPGHCAFDFNEALENILNIQ